MSIAFGGIVALVFRGMNLLVAFGTVLLTSRLLAAENYGVFVLGLSIIGFVNAMTGGLTAATAYQVSNRRRAPGEAMANGIVISGALGPVAGLAACAFAIAWLSGVSPATGIAVGFASAAVIMNSVTAGVFLGRDSLVRYNVALVVPPLLAIIFIAV